MGKTVSYNRPDGKSVNGYLAEPAGGGKAPAVVVIQEWWGLNDQIRGETLEAFLKTRRVPGAR